MLLQGKNFISIVTSVVFVMGVFALTPMSRAQEDDADDTPSLSYEEAMVVVAASAGDQDDLSERLGEMSSEEIQALIAKISLTRSGSERAALLSTILNKAITLQPLDDLNSFSSDMMAAVIENTGGDTESAKAAMKGLVSGSYDHPELEGMSSDDATGIIAGVAENSASGAIGAAEENPDLEASNVVDVAGSLADGGYEAISEGADPGDRMNSVADAMARGGVGAAREPNRPDVALAMLRAAGNITDLEMRRRAAGGAAAGGGNAGGQDVADVLDAEVPRVEDPQQQPPAGGGVAPDVPGGVIDVVQPEDRSPR